MPKIPEKASRFLENSLSKELLLEFSDNFYVVPLMKDENVTFSFIRFHFATQNITKYKLYWKVVYNKDVFLCFFDSEQSDCFYVKKHKFKKVSIYEESYINKMWFYLNKYEKVLLNENEDLTNKIINSMLYI